ncbi:hypothetical protein [Lentzea sp. NPDC004782]|uniref:hypothetical protein n=1 Tax=Lentzea sp. NPDC004782 TaxID=3154458 RepID=UPI0033ADDE03
MHLQPERLEQLASECLRQFFEIAPADRQETKQIGVLLVVGLLLKRRQLGGEFGTFGLDLGTPVLDVLDEFLVGLTVVVTGDLKGADQSLLPRIQIRDGFLDGRDSIVSFLLRSRVKVSHGGRQQLLPVQPEHVVAEEVIQAA